MNKILGAALLAFVLAACDNSGKRKAATPVTPAPAFPSTSTPVTPAPGQQQMTTTAPGTTPVQPAPNTNAVALNPAHGLPGHRCDIPEGAPLNTAPVSTTLPPPTISNTSPVVNQQPVNNTNAKLNPPHGQPGHDCSVPVGQPLKS